jgi:hypothetical protein
VSAAAPAAAPFTPSRPPGIGEACPLCGSALHPEQEWCLSCGAAARTRLAAAPSWKGLVAVLAVIVVLCLGVLAAALVKLAGNSSATASSTTTTVTVPASATQAPGTVK